LPPALHSRQHGDALDLGPEAAIAEVTIGHVSGHVGACQLAAHADGNGESPVGIE